MFLNLILGVYKGLKEPHCITNELLYIGYVALGGQYISSGEQDRIFKP